MKRKFLVFALFLVSILGYGQFECSPVIINNKNGFDIPNSEDFSPNENTPIRYIRINFHFMLKEIGEPDYPGNFTEIDDGKHSTDLTGYDYAERIIATANSRLSLNSNLNLPPNNSIPVLPTKYRYYLNGVFFHRDNNYYYYSNNSQTLYGENIEDCINVYFDNNPSGSTSGGNANLVGKRRILLMGAWEGFHEAIESGYGYDGNIFVIAGALNHEVGHNLSLRHTMRSANGPCTNNAQDYCSDTPTRGEIIEEFDYDPCCGWGGGSNPYCSNNLMDYSGSSALSPQQLGRVHWTLRYELSHCLISAFQKNIAFITNNNLNKAYIAKTVKLTNIVKSGKISENKIISSRVVINTSQAIYINANEFVIDDAELEIKEGGMLYVYTLE